MIAVYEFKNNQYLVSEGQVINMPFFSSEKNKIIFDKVLLIADDKQTQIGKPEIKEARVEAEIQGKVRSAKKPVVKFKAKKRYKKIGSARQDIVKVKIEKIIQK